MTTRDYAWAVALISALVWMSYVDGSVACGLGWDASNISMCGWVAILRELITVGGAICGLWAIERSFRKKRGIAA